MAAEISLIVRFYGTVKEQAPLFWECAEHHNKTLSAEQLVSFLNQAGTLMN